MRVIVGNISSTEENVIAYLITSPIEFSYSDQTEGEYIYNGNIEIGTESTYEPVAEILQLETTRLSEIEYCNIIVNYSIEKNNEDLLSNYYLHFTSESNSEKIERDRSIRPQKRYGNNSVLDTKDTSGAEYTADPIDEDIAFDQMVDNTYGRKSSRRKRKKGKKVSKHKPKPKLKPKPKHKPKKKKKSVKNKKNKKNYK